MISEYDFIDQTDWNNIFVGLLLIEGFYYYVTAFLRLIVILFSERYYLDNSYGSYLKIYLA